MLSKEVTPLCTIAVVLLMLLFFSTSGQVNVPRVIPPTPEAAAFQKYINWPVSHYSGISNVSIPLWQITAGDYVLPISLNYHAGGIKVEELSTWTGLGWSLDYGGMVSRSVYGKPDMGNWENLGANANYWFTQDIVNACGFQPACLCLWASPNRYASRNSDLQPDVFSYSVPGYSGKFLYKNIKDANNNYPLMEIPESDVTIEGYNGGFMIITPDGTRYKFTVTESQISWTTIKILNSFEFGGSLPDTKNAWFLSEIETNKGIKIQFDYETVTLDPYIIRSAFQNYENVNIFYNQPKPDEDVYTKIILTKKQLKSISTPTTRVEFKATTPRYDLTGDHVLDEIVVTDLNTGKVVKNFMFSYYYLRLGSGHLTPAQASTAEPVDLRLMLEKVEEVGLPPYQFYYFEDKKLPDRLSFEQDWWGFYKQGAHILGKYYSNTNSTLLDFTAQKQSRLEDTRANSLKKIMYPTGGSIEFEYHLNQDIFKGTVGGLRTSKISFFEKDGVKSLEKEYTYSMGRLISEIPNEIVYTLREGSITPTNTAVGWGCDPSSYGMHKVRIPTTSYPLNISNGVVGYGMVEERIVSPDEEHRTVYTFTSPSEYPDYFAFNADPDDEDNASNDFQSYPFIPVNDRSWARGLLLTQEEYSGASSVPVKKTVNVYDVNLLPGERAYDAVVGSNVYFLYHAEPLEQDYDCCNITTYSYYQISTGSVLLRESRTTQDGVEVKTTYDYSPNHMAPVSTKTSIGGDRHKVVESKYVLDYIHDSGMLEMQVEQNDITDFQQLAQRKMNPLICTKTIIEKGQSREIIDLTYTDYESFEGMYLPKNIYQIESKNPIPVSVSLGQFLKKKSTFSYDLSGNIVEILKEDEHPISYLWGYRQSIPIAQGVNSVKERFLHTSFENETSKGGWEFTYDNPDQCPDLQQCLVGCASNSTCEVLCQLNYSQCIDPLNIALQGKTGGKCFKSGSIGKGNLPPGDYKLSFWAKRRNHGVNGNVSISGIGSHLIDNSSWQYFEFTLNSISGISLSVTDALLDELRLYPVESTMTSYTYDPLTGITSITDANNITTYYEYDAHGHLKVIKDSNGNVLHTYFYHYKGQASIGASFDGLNENYVVSAAVQENGILDGTNILTLPAGRVNQTIEYFDGLGRPTQIVSRQMSPGGFDIVQAITYDEFGRQKLNYLPFVLQDGSGWYKSDAVGKESGNYTASPQYQFYQTAEKMAHDTKPYSETIFESSPLNRVLKQGATGEVWQPDADPLSTTDRTIKYRYESNGTNEVLNFTYDPSTDVVDARENGSLRFYDPNELYAHKTIDEHGNETIEYTDKEGKTVLKKVQYAEENGFKLYAETYYIYDDFGNLVVVLPPEGVKEYLSSQH